MTERPSLSKGEMEVRVVPAFPGVRPVEVTSRRLERIMQLRHGCRNRAPWWYWVAMLGLAVATLPGAAWVTADEAPVHSLVPSLFQAKSRPPVPQDLDAAPGQPVPLPFAAPKAADPTPLGPMIAQEYDVADVLAKTRNEFDCRKAEARDRVANAVVAAGGSNWARAGVDVDMDENGEAKFYATAPDPTQPELRFSGSKFTIRHDEAGHQRIAARLEQIRRYGYAQLQVEIRFISAQPEVIDQAVPNWQLSPMELPATDEHDMAAVNLDEWAAEVEQRRASRSVSSIEQFQPLQFQIFDRRQSERIIAMLQADEQTNILMSPKLTVFNGQTAMIQDSVQRPFVVGFKDAQPQIRVISEGVTLKLKPHLLPTQPVDQASGDVAVVSHLSDSPSLQLDFELVRSEILDVSTTTVNVTGQAKPVTLQVPRVQSSRVESAVVTPLDQTLIVGGLQNRDEDGTTRSLLVAMTVRRVEPELPRRLFGTGVNSDAGVTGEIVLDEREFAQEAGSGKDTDKDAAQDPIAVRVYSVADLVIPLPKAPVIRWNGKHDAWASQDDPRSAVPADVDFASLIQRIQTAVAPNSWESAGGRGAVRAFPANLSLVVSQTPDVHEEIVDLLEQLRRLQDVQVTLEMRVIGLTDDDLSEETTDFSFEIDDIPITDDDPLAEHGRTILSDIETFFMVQVAQRGSQPHIFAPKFTMFDGQTATVQVGDEQNPYTLLLRPVVSADKKAVRLSYSTGRGAAELTSLNEDGALGIPEGHTLLIDPRGDLKVADLGWSEPSGVPMLEKIPYVMRLFKNTPHEPSVAKIFVLITPRIIIQEHEEVLITDGYND